MTVPSQELGDLSEEVLQRGGVVRFEATGASMWPFIRPGDMLRVASLDGAAPAVGDVLLYRRADERPIAHRLVEPARAAAGGRHRFCADARPGEWESVAPEDVLGRVVSLERAGQRLHLDRGPERWPGQVWARGYPVTVGLSLGMRLLRRLVGYGT